MRAEIVEHRLYESIPKVALEALVMSEPTASSFLAGALGSN